MIVSQNIEIFTRQNVTPAAARWSSRVTATTEDYIPPLSKLAICHVKIRNNWVMVVYSSLLRSELALLHCGR